MVEEQFDITITWTTTSPLHLGNGETKELTRDGHNEPIEYAPVVRDGDDKPYLTGSTLKGALNALAEQYFPDENTARAVLFGLISDQAQGSMGRLLVYGGALEQAPAVDQMPYADPSRPHTFIAASTQIDDASGVAGDHLLFHQEQVPADARFVTRMVLLVPQDSEAHGLARRLFALVARDGLSIGKATSAGNGQLHVGNAITVQHRKLDHTGSFTNWPVPDFINVEAPKSPLVSHAVYLHCDGPCIVRDASVTERQEGDNAQVKAQRMGLASPLIPPSTIKGVLRSRLEWLLQCAGHDKTLADTIFGTTDAAALVDVRNIAVSDGEAMDITSVKLDSFTGGPVDGALFTMNCFLDVSLSFDLTINRRGAVQEDVGKALEMLVAEIRQNGLMIGAATNRGFGWFQTEGEGHHASG
ncbi:MAG: RAMP superfamily CRISPR-associated protein [Pseudomonadota bacterium]